MAAALAALLVFLLTAAASALEPGHGHVPPHLTGCLSNNMETFNCRWSVGSFQNLSEPGDLRLFYYNRKPLTAPQENWSECPQYSMERPNECFFDQNHTTIWTTYTIQLRSRDQDVLYDETPVEVSVIVKPDPPVGLNWTLMNVSLTSAHFDIMLSWKPPRSADVETGWLTLLYEVQYRDVDSDEWKVMNLVKSPHRSVFGLQTNVHHEVRVRCKMLGGKLFGEFSDSVFVHISSKVSRFPVVALLMFGVFCLVAVLMFVVILQQEKLMFILLPPVPGPKIRGIDPDLLKVKEKQVQQLVSRMRAEEEHHQRALEAVRQQCHREALHQLETKDAEVKKLLEEKDLDLEEMRRKLKDQERERQSELLKLQMELGAKLARAQSSAQRSHQQQLHGPNLLPQSVFKRKLQYFQEEKNKEISALRQRIRELEASQRASSLSDSKRRKM
ncbi:transcript variant X2 [Nothobranchius furzeri]|uniref:Transcript variant X2 n=3 Tax=Nothobranchius TaxID=28779 RepID=A0A9D2YCS3_NOTFU|nr:transcript variant X2 [Nothobranchius furzeri]